jgi:hypothetical protein
MLVRAVVIRYNRAVGVVVLAIGVAAAAMSVLMVFQGLSSIGGLCYRGVFASIWFAIGLGLLVRPLGELTSTELAVRSPYGFRSMRYPADQLRVVRGRMYCGKRLIFASWTANRDDWQSLLQRVPPADLV